MFQSTQPMRVTMTSVLQTVAGITIRKIILFFGALALSAMPSLGQIVETYPVVFSNTVGFSNVVLATHTTSSNCPSDNNVPNAFFVRTQLSYVFATQIVNTAAISGVSSTQALHATQFGKLTNSLVLYRGGLAIGSYGTWAEAAAVQTSGDTVYVQPGSYLFDFDNVPLSNGVDIVGAGRQVCELSIGSSTFTSQTNRIQGVSLNGAINIVLWTDLHLTDVYMYQSGDNAIYNTQGTGILYATGCEFASPVDKAPPGRLYVHSRHSSYSALTATETNYYETGAYALDAGKLGGVVASQYLTNCTTYGQLFMDETQEQNLDATYKPITNMLSTNLLNVTAPVSAASNLTPVVAGMYFCAFNIGFAGGVGEEYEFAIFVNNVEENNIQTQRKTSSADIGSAGGSGLLNLSANAVVDLRAKSLDAAADFDPIKVQLILHRLN